MRKPVLVGHPAPFYPEPMRKLGKSADVLVRILVDENGRAVEVESGGETTGYGFDAEAMKVARRSHWEPATKYGVPVKMWVELRLSFRP